MKNENVIHTQQLQPLVGQQFHHKNSMGEIYKVEVLSDSEIALYLEGKQGNGLVKVIVMPWGDIVPVKCKSVEEKTHNVGNFLLDAMINGIDCVKAIGDLLE